MLHHLAAAALLLSTQVAADRPPKKDLDAEFESLVKDARAALCTKKDAPPVCPHLEAFTAAAKPLLPAGEWLTFGRYAVLEEKEIGAEYFLALRSRREKGRIQLGVFPVKPDSDEEAADSRALVDALAKKAEPSGGTWTFLKSAAPKQKVFEAEATAKSLVYRDPETGLADGSVVVRQKGPWLYAVRLTGTLEHPVLAFAWLPAPKGR